MSWQLIKVRFDQLFNIVISCFEILSIVELKNTNINAILWFIASRYIYCYKLLLFLKYIVIIFCMIYFKSK